MARALGKALRETGQALDRLGRSLQGNYAFREERECDGVSRPPGMPGSAARPCVASPPLPSTQPPPRPPPDAVSRHRSLAPLAGKAPSLGSGVFVAPSAAVIGDVTLGSNASVFYGSVIRGAVAAAALGPCTQRCAARPRCAPPPLTAACAASAVPQPTAAASALATRRMCRTAA